MGSLIAGVFFGGPSAGVAFSTLPMLGPVVDIPIMTRFGFMVGYLACTTLVVVASD